LVLLAVLLMQWSCTRSDNPGGTFWLQLHWAAAG